MQSASERVVGLWRRIKTLIFRTTYLYKNRISVAVGEPPSPLGWIFHATPPVKNHPLNVTLRALLLSNSSQRFSNVSCKLLARPNIPFRRLIDSLYTVVYCIVLHRPTGFQIPFLPNPVSLWNQHHPTATVVRPFRNRTSQPTPIGANKSMASWFVLKHYYIHLGERSASQSIADQIVDNLVNNKMYALLQLLYCLVMRTVDRDRGSGEESLGRSSFPSLRYAEKIELGISSQVAPSSTRLNFISVGFPSQHLVSHLNINRCFRLSGSPTRQQSEWKNIISVSSVARQLHMNWTRNL